MSWLRNVLPGMNEKAWHVLVDRALEMIESYVIALDASIILIGHSALSLLEAIVEQVYIATVQVRNRLSRIAGIIVLIGLSLAM